MARKGRLDTLWTYHDVSTTLAHSSAGSLYDFTGVLENQVAFTPSDYTIRRIVGSMSISAPAGSSAYDSAKIFLGLGVFDVDAVSAGAYPEPWADNAHWMWTHAGQIYVPDNPSASLATPCYPDHLALPMVDIRQARRIKGRGYDLRLVGYDDSGITGTLNFSMTVRALWSIRQ